MGIKAQKRLMFSLLLVGATLQADTVLEDSLDEFLDRMAEDSEKDGFRTYYSQFLEKQSRHRKNRKQRQLRRIRSASLRKIREEHTEWYKELEPYALDLDEPEARKARIFLTRFALLQEYRQGGQEGPGLWETTKGYFKSFGNKMVELKDRALGRKKPAKA